jgi:CsoR family transcriptional regulator, copper-sensing transcriptional repressor
MAQIADTSVRKDLLNRLKRAEGQLRGIQRMLEEGESCLDVAGQMAAVRKALDSAHVRLTVGFMQQEMQGRLALPEGSGAQILPLLDEVQVLMAKVR